MANARPSRMGPSDQPEPKNPQAAEEDSLAADKSDVRVVIAVDGERGAQANYPKRMELPRKQPNESEYRPGWYKTKTTDNRGVEHEITVEDF